MKHNSRRIFIRKAGLGLGAFSLLSHRSGYPIFPATPDANGLYFTTGCKTMEVSSSSVLLWTRLCASERPHPVTYHRLEKVFRHPIEFDETMPVSQMDGAVRGSEGLVRATLTGGKRRYQSNWYLAVADQDFTVRIAFGALRPHTDYKVLWEAKAQDNGKIYSTGTTFRTAPAVKTFQPIQLVTSTCQYFWSYDEDQRGFQTYDSMRKLNPDFFVQTGDYVYYDKPGPLAKTIEKARHKWHAMDAWPALVDLYRQVPAYLLKDDHDLLDDDADPSSPAYGSFSFEDGLKVWRENVPLGSVPYRTFRWGVDLQIWLAEGREFRTPNKTPDSIQKTIWGPEQKAWFQRTVLASDATFKILFSPTPIVGPDRENKTDNHANPAFATEGNWLRHFLADQKNMYVVNGDRHWQYVSVDAETGLTEFGSGPVSDAHAQGWEESDVREQHRFLRLKGGFLGIKIDRENQGPVIVFTHYTVAGEPVHTEVRTG